jgi:hypothetical protein
MLERWTFLHKVVAYQPERAALREYGSFLVDRSVLKTINEMRGYAIAVSNLSQITFGYGVTIQSPQHKKTVDFAFGVNHGHLRRRNRSDMEKRATRQNYEKSFRPQKF